MSRALRIDLVAVSSSPLAPLGGEDAGGQNAHVAALAAELGRQGCEVRVFTRRDGAHLPPSVELAPGVTVEHLPAGPPTPVRQDELFPHLPGFADHLARRWRADPPDLVHAHFWLSGWAASQATAAGSAGSRSRVPLVQTFHGLGVVKARHRREADPSSPRRRPVETELMAEADHIVATCVAEAAELAALGADRDKVTVVPGGVDHVTFRPVGARMRVPEPPGHRPRRYRLVVAGRLIPRKGIDDVVRALAALPEAELVVAGGPSGTVAVDADPEARRLLDIARQEDVADRVTFLGGLPRRMVPPLLRSADVVVSTPWYEPFGAVPLEAMACGVPVVATAVGGHLDTVQPERTGLLVEPNDPAAIATAVRRLLSNPSLRHRMGEEAVALARERFSWEQVARSTLDVYEQFTGAHDPGWWKVSA